jgi:hypothetical protein
VVEAKNSPTLPHPLSTAKNPFFGWQSETVVKILILPCLVGQTQIIFKIQACNRGF